jgi:Fe-S-cluster containining protein
MTDATEQRLPLPDEPPPGEPRAETVPLTALDGTTAGLGQGLRYLHVWTSRTREDAWKAMLGVHTLMELLVGKGLITPEELEAQGTATAPRVHEAFAADPLAPMLGETPDKYAAPSPAIDCAARLHLCQARCCTLRFALSAQDLDEGLVRWEYARPYLIAQRADGYCTHCHPETRDCGVYVNRPAPCRTYDCRQDERIWTDFDRRVPADYAVLDAERAAERAASQRAVGGSAIPLDQAE